MAEIDRIEIDPLNPPPPRVIEVLDGPPSRPKSTPRPKGTSTKHLTELDRFRVRTLYYDARMTTARIRQITGYSKSQIRTAIKAQTAAIGRRSGRPKEPAEKRGKKSSKHKKTTAKESDANAELIRQAREYFAHKNPVTAAEEATPAEDEGDDDQDEVRESEDEGDDESLPDALATPLPVTPLALVTPSAPATPLVSASTSASPAQTLAVGSLREDSAEEVSSAEGRTTFKILPHEIRIHIWRCVLSTAPSQVAPLRTWALAVLPRAPWLELGMTPPPDMKIENPPWDHYVNERHVPVTVLTRVNREARGVVLERFTPIRVSTAAPEASKNLPFFIWIDRWSDVIHFFGEPFRLELFEMAGKCAYPKLYT